MKDFVVTYSGKAATTEDFKLMMEKHMTREMDMEGNHRLDWFFNEYVYGTALPTYKFTYSIDKDANGDALLNTKVTQSGVDDKFRMLVPISLEMTDGRVLYLGRARLVGNTTAEQKVSLKTLKETPKRAVINYNDDVLASN
jgi:aminopeptidase N